ncbi:hypothetical protein ACJX0J_040018, partial [Zea mays]
FAQKLGLQMISCFFYTLGVKYKCELVSKITGDCGRWKMNVLSFFPLESTFSCCMPILSVAHGMYFVASFPM